MWCFGKRGGRDGWWLKSPGHLGTLYTLPTTVPSPGRGCYADSFPFLYGPRRASGWVPLDADKSKVQGSYNGCDAEMAVYIPRYIMNAQMSLSGGGKGMFGDVSEASSSSVIPVTCKGKVGELTIVASTGVIFNVLEVQRIYHTGLVRHRLAAARKCNNPVTLESCPSKRDVTAARMRRERRQRALQY